MKKLLFVVNIDWAFILNRLPIAIKAKQEGYDVHIACAISDKKQYLESFGFKVHEVPFSRSGKNIFEEFKTMFQLRRLIKRLSPDLVHSITIKPVLYTGLILRTLKIKRFVAAISGLGLVFISEGKKARLQRYFIELIYKLAVGQKDTQVIFQNDFDRSVIVKATNLSPEQCVMIKGSGADLNEYGYQPEPTGTKVVIMVARLLREKGVYEYLAAAKQIKDKGIDVVFKLIGEPDTGNPNSILVSEFETWKKSSDVEILGYRSDIALLVKNSNIVALPSYYGEGLPKVLIEAAACGRASVTTDNPGCAAAVIHEKTGLIIPAQNVSELVDALEKLLVNDDMRMKMGKQGRKFAEEEFNIEGVVAKHLSIYENLLNTKV